MDVTDIEILKCLRENARMTASSVAARVNLSVSAVTDRIRRLEECGAVEQYTVLLNPAVIGQETLAYMEVTLIGSEYSEVFGEAIRKQDAVLRCDYISGEFDFLLLCQVSDVENLSRLHTTVKSIAGVRNVRVRLILRTLKNSTTALPQGAQAE